MNHTKKSLQGAKVRGTASVLLVHKSYILHHHITSSLKAQNYPQEQTSQNCHSCIKTSYPPKTLQPTREDLGKKLEKNCHSLLGKIPFHELVNRDPLYTATNQASDTEVKPKNRTKPF